MTYHNKLLLKNCVKIAVLVILALLFLFILVFTYLGRYLVYDQSGAHFRFDSSSIGSSGNAEALPSPSSAVLVSGDSIERNDITNEEAATISSNSVRGILLNYETLSSGSTLNSVDLSGNCNTLILEMRTAGSNILNTPEVNSLISRAKQQGIQLKALISCLDDNQYALDHPEDSLRINGGALWVSPTGTYYLNPGSESVQQRIVSFINSLSDAGFEEVILERFEYPLSSNVNDGLDTDTREALLCEAYRNIQAASKCPIGILVTNADNGHQAMYDAERLYVYYTSGASVDQYASYYTDRYLVFITNSHDTRFDNYGKISIDFEIEDDSMSYETDVNAVDDDTQEDESPATEIEADTETQNPEDIQDEPVQTFEFQ